MTAAAGVQDQIPDDAAGWLTTAERDLFEGIEDSGDVQGLTDLVQETVVRHVRRAVQPYRVAARLAASPAESVPEDDEYVSGRIEDAEDATAAISARARGDHEAERRALDRMALRERARAEADATPRCGTCGDSHCLC